MKVVKRCEHCNAKMVEYRHVLNKSLVNILVYILDNNYELVMKDVRGRLTHNQLANLQKLRYFDLIVNPKDEEGKRIDGVWILTETGLDFVFGNIGVKKAVFTYRGEPQRFDGETVFFKDIDEETWRKKQDYIKDQVAKRFDGPQGLLF